MTTSSELSTEFLDSLDLMEPAGEYFDGEVTQKPTPRRAHSRMQSYLIAALLNFLEKYALGEASVEWRCVFGPPGAPRTFVPDLRFVAADRLTGEDYVRVAPDIAIEALSPGQPDARFTRKIQYYLDYGVRIVWIIDPADRSIQVLVPDQEPSILSSGDTLDGGAVLPEFRLALDELFARL